MARAQKWLPVVPAGRERGRRRHAEDLGPVAHQPAVEVAEPQVVADRQAQSSQRGRDDDRAIARRDALRLAVANRLGDVDVEEVDLVVAPRPATVGPEDQARGRDASVSTALERHGAGDDPQAQLARSGAEKLLHGT